VATIFHLVLQILEYFADMVHFVHRMSQVLNSLIYYACERLYSRDNGEALVNKSSKSEGSMIKTI